MMRCRASSKTTRKCSRFSSRKRSWKASSSAVALDEPVFLSSKGRANWDHRWSWRKALERAGLHRRKGLTLYSLRHSFATHYLERGSPADLQALLGHTSYATTERYVRAVSTRTRTGVELLDLGLPTLAANK